MGCLEEGAAGREEVTGLVFKAPHQFPDGQFPILGPSLTVCDCDLGQVT